MNIEIVPMDKTHLDGVIEIEKLSFSIPWSKNMLLSEMVSSQTIYYTAIINGQVCGYGGMWKIMDEGHITNIAVHPNNRKLGVGQKMLERLICDAKKYNLKFLTLEVRASNLSAISLYEKNEFVICGRRNAYYADNYEDALIMTRYLV